MTKEYTENKNQTSLSYQISFNPDNYYTYVSIYRADGVMHFAYSPDEIDELFEMISDMNSLSADEFYNIYIVYSLEYRGITYIYNLNDMTIAFDDRVYSKDCEGFEISAKYLKLKDYTAYFTYYVITDEIDSLYRFGYDTYMLMKTW